MNRDIRMITNHVCETNDYIDHFYVSTWGFATYQPEKVNKNSTEFS